MSLSKINYFERTNWVSFKRKLFYVVMKRKCVNVSSVKKYWASAKKNQNMKNKEIREDENLL